MIDPMLSFGVACLAVLLAAICLLMAAGQKRKTRVARELAAFIEKQVEDLDTSVAKLREGADLASQRLSEQSRHIAWLEARARKVSSLGDEVIGQEPATNKRLNMTERRHRVTALAAKGQNVDAIASSLAMLPGEVELIMDIQRAALQVR